MLLNQETLRFVFGLKLRSLRVDRGLSLKDLSKKTGLAPSYLNEIEKGKKYPKTDKILILAEVLGEKLEDLISLELKKELQLIQQLIDKKFLTGIPFDIFGVPAGTVFELLAEHPKKMQALVGTWIEIARAHNIQVDDLFFALLRSYQDMNKNYFPQLEESANQARVQYSLDPIQNPEELKHKLTTLLKKHYGVQIEDQKTLSEIAPEFASLEYLALNKGKNVFIDKSLSLTEKIFILSRELGYHVLKLKIRTQSSLTSQLDSFEQLFNLFSANYFASSLLIPEEMLVQQMQPFLQNKTWSEAQFMKIAQHFPCGIENVFHRLTQLLPKHAGIEHLFFLRYEYDILAQKYEVARELHLATLHSPHKVKGHEHYCSRWLVHKLTQTKVQDSGQNSIHELGIQRSHFSDSNNEYLIIAAAFPKDRARGHVACVCLGLLNNDQLKHSVQFLEDEAIPKRFVGETCERCTVADCPERKAAFEPGLNPQRFHSVFLKIQQLEKEFLT